jgi:hypothetical protein
VDPILIGALILGAGLLLLGQHSAPPALPAPNRFTPIPPGSVTASNQQGQNIQATGGAIAQVIGAIGTVAWGGHGNPSPGDGTQTTPPPAASQSSFQSSYDPSQSSSIQLIDFGSTDTNAGEVNSGTYPYNAGTTV